MRSLLLMHFICQVDIHEGIICIDGLELKNPQNREWRSPYLLTAKRTLAYEMLF